MEQKRSTKFSNRNSKNATKQTQKANVRKESGMTTYSLTVNEENFAKELNALTVLVPVAKEIFGASFKGTTVDAADCIFDAMKKNYKKSKGFWSCNLKSKSAQIMTNERIGFGWLEIPKEKKVIMSVFIAEKNEELEKLLKEVEYVKSTK